MTTALHGRHLSKRAVWPVRFADCQSPLAIAAPVLAGQLKRVVDRVRKPRQQARPHSSTAGSRAGQRYRQKGAQHNEGHCERQSPRDGALCVRNNPCRGGQGQGTGCSQPSAAVSSLAMGASIHCCSTGKKCSSQLLPGPLRSTTRKSSCGCKASTGWCHTPRW